MRDRFLFVRPPRPLWPFNGPTTAFWPPLAFASLAAALREGMPDLDVGILDAPALQMGWRSLEAELRRQRPTYVGIGEEAVSCVEGFRLARLAQALGARVIAGGCFFGHVAEEVLSTGLVDVVVHGEGEVTIVELIAALRTQPGSELERVAGISFRDGDAVRRTAARGLIADLDRLPMPAYDLLPVAQYGARSRNHPALAAIELGRGCIDTCDFCVLWRQMGRAVSGRVAPALRVKSADRLFEEIKVLAERHGRRYLGWVDPCFNAHPKVPGELAERLLRAGLRLGQSAWARADTIVRDAASGALATCVDSGLNELYLGVERPDPSGLATLCKHLDPGRTREAMRILRARFPGVCVVGSFIYGLPGDTPALMRAIHRMAGELDLDQFFFIPLTPLPGTPGWRSDMWDPTGEAFRRFNFLPTANRRGRLAELERALALSVLLHWHPARIAAHLRKLCLREARRRRVTWHLVSRAATFQIRRFMEATFGWTPTDGLIFPAWYEN